MAIFIDTPVKEMEKLIGAINAAGETKSAGLLRSLWPVAHADITATVSDAAAAVSDRVAGELAQFKRVENYERTMVGCANGYAQLWEMFWAKPVRTTATMILHPIDSARSIKAEVLAYWDGGSQMIKDYFAAAHKKIKNFDNWSIEEKSALFCQLQAPTVAKAYFPKPGAGAVTVMEEQVAKAAVDAKAKAVVTEAKFATSVPKPPPLTAPSLMEEFKISEALAKRIANEPPSAESFAAIQRSQAAQYGWYIDDGVRGMFPTSTSYTGIGKMKTYLSDGNINLSIYADVDTFMNSAAMGQRMPNVIQRAIQETREATGHMTYAPESLWQIKPSVNPPGYEHWHRFGGHDGGMLVRLKGHPDDIVFMEKLKKISYGTYDNQPMMVAPRVD